LSSPSENDTADAEDPDETGAAGDPDSDESVAPGEINGVAAAGTRCHGGGRVVRCPFRFVFGSPAETPGGTATRTVTASARLGRFGGSKGSVDGTELGGGPDSGTGDERYTPLECATSPSVVTSPSDVNSPSVVDALSVVDSLSVVDAPSDDDAGRFESWGSVGLVTS
jgi:hypothetical protein